MNDHSGKTTSVWMESVSIPQEPKLTSDLQTTVCVVGAGIAGLSTAYMLCRAGLPVVVLDDGPIGAGETERTTAHLSNALDERYFNLQRLHGLEGARLAAESHTAAIAEIERIVTEEKIDCEFERVPGYLFNPLGESPDLLRRELDAARDAGLRDIEMLSRAPLDFFNTGPCLLFPRQAQFHPLRYLQGLSEAICNAGGRIFCNTRANGFESGPPAVIETDTGHRVTAEYLVMATNTPVNDRVTIHTKQAPYRSYVITARVPRGFITKALYWDTENPYHYVRLQSILPGNNNGEVAHDLLMVGGEDHKTGQAHDAESRWTALEVWTRERFPIIGKIEHRWSGQVMEPVDGLAFIGRNPHDQPHIYIATGDSGHGMTHGTLAGLLLTDLILERENRWAALYDPSRIRVRAAGEFARENLNVAAQYGDWATGGAARREADISEGSGAVVRRGLKKFAVYRDEQGTLHECSAVCPHLGCIVTWNHAEKTWDCPCHGSRFDRFGTMLNGPAMTDLAPISEPAKI